MTDDDLVDVPVFPLPQVVLFPNERLPLHIFEPRYRAMLADCLGAGGAIVIAQVSRADGRIAGVAGAGVIVDHQPLPDGRSNIIIAGRTRVRLDELVTEDPPRYPYKRARVTRLSDRDVRVSEAERSALLAVAAMFATEVKKHDPEFELRLPPHADAGALADACAFQLVVDPDVRQGLLAELDPRARVRIVTDQLATQHGAILGDVEGTVYH